MFKLLTISKNTFIETLRQPIYAVIIIFALLLMLLAPAVSMYTLDEDINLLRELGLSTLFLAGLFISVFAATGAITETDVMLASASDAIIIGFNVRPAGKVSETAEAERVEIKTYEVIYQMLDDVTAALTGMLAPLIEEEVIGRVEVRDTFGVPKVGTIAGSYVTSGKVERNAMARLLRDGKVIANTKISSLRRFKDDVKEVAQGFECGIGLENYNDIKLGDEIEVYVTHEVAASL